MKYALAALLTIISYSASAEVKPWADWRESIVAEIFASGDVAAIDSDITDEDVKIGHSRILM